MSMHPGKRRDLEKDLAKHIYLGGPSLSDEREVFCIPFLYLKPTRTKSLVAF